MSINIQLSDKKRQFERTVYSVIDLLGDAGGFYGAIVSVFSSIVSWYSTRMYQASISNEMPVKANGRRTKRKSSLQRKLDSPNWQNSSLAPDDIKILADEVKRVENNKLSFCDSICGSVKFLCRERSKKQRLKKKTTELFENQLDIRSFVSVQKNLALLIWLMLTKEQRLLFWNHSGRVVTTKKHSPTTSSDFELSDDVPKLKLGSMLKPKKASKALQQLNGYSILSEIDKKLLLGVFEKTAEDKHRSTRIEPNRVEPSMVNSSQVNLDLRNDRMLNYTAAESLQEPPSTGKVQGSLRYKDRPRITVEE